MQYFSFTGCISNFDVHTNHPKVLIKMQNLFHLGLSLHLRFFHGEENVDPLGVLDWDWKRRMIRRKAHKYIYYKFYVTWEISWGSKDLKRQLNLNLYFFFFWVWWRVDSRVEININQKVWGKCTNCGVPRTKEQGEWEGSWNVGTEKTRFYRSPPAPMPRCNYWGVLGPSWVVWPVSPSTPDPHIRERYLPYSFPAQCT